MAVTCLDELLKLQELDLRLRDLELRLKTMPQEMKNMISRRDNINKNTAAAASSHMGIAGAVHSRFLLFCEAEGNLPIYRSRKLLSWLLYHKEHRGRKLVAEVCFP